MPDCDAASDVERGELDRAISLVSSFAAAMAAWEGDCAMQARVRPPEQMDQNELQELLEAQRRSCQGVFDGFCTDRPRGNDRPGVAHYADPSDYGSDWFRVERAEFHPSRRIHVYAMGDGGKRFRFTVVKKQAYWRVDQREVWDGSRWVCDRL